MNDPFASAADEAQTETSAEPAESTFDEPPAEAPKKAPAKKAAPKKAAAKVEVEEGEDGKVTLTFKGGSGFDAPWIVIHANSLEDAYAQVTGENAKLLAEIMRETQRAGQFFAGLGPAKSGGGNRGGDSGAAAKPERQQAPNGEQRFCKHGEMEFKSGVSKAGNAYQLFSCTSKDRNDQCDAQYLNKKR